MIYPEPEPIAAPVMMQDWRHLTFLHWRYPLNVVAALVPKPLTVETFDGSAWVGLVPFVIENLRPPFAPSLPWISRFPETNCRTYVRAPDGSPGVWFFSLDAARLPAVIGARIGYGLPYFWARMRVESDNGTARYRSERYGPLRGGTELAVKIGVPMEATDLDIFLTARFRLYSLLLGRLMYAKVDHPPWPLQQARAVQLEQTLLHAAGLPQPAGEPLAHFTTGVRVRVAAPSPVKIG